MPNKKRCQWSGSDELMTEYHDKEWGTPTYDDQKIFEALVLDSFQAGLSWQIILRKRENFRKAFDNFNYKKIAKYTEEDRKRLLRDAGIVRNRLKIDATITNSQKFLEIQKEFGSFANYIWQFTSHKTKHNKFRTLKEIPAKTPESDAMSKDMKSHGFKFVGSTTLYAFMQGIGMVNDHTTDCFRYKK